MGYKQWLCLWPNGALLNDIVLPALGLSSPICLGSHVHGSASGHSLVSDLCPIYCNIWDQESRLKRYFMVIWYICQYLRLKIMSSMTSCRLDVTEWGWSRYLDKGSVSTVEVRIEISYLPFDVWNEKIATMDCRPGMKQRWRWWSFPALSIS